MVNTQNDIINFFADYAPDIADRAFKLGELLKKTLPGVTEQLDRPAKMVAYVYGQKYADMICTIIPSKKGLKLGFYKGNELEDPAKLLEGTGKISRYVEIKSEKDIESPALQKLIQAAFEGYKERSQRNK